MRNRFLKKVFLCSVGVLVLSSSQVPMTNLHNNIAIANTNYSEAELDNLVAEFKSVKYGDFYNKLQPYVRYVERINIQTELRKKLNRTPTDAELDEAVRKFYMDKLDMELAFNKVQDNIKQHLVKMLNSSNTTIAEVKNKKLDVLLGLTYLERQFSFSFGDKKVSDLILYNDKSFNSHLSSFDRLKILGSMSYLDLELSNNVATFTKYVKLILGHNSIVDFIEAGIRDFDSGKSLDDWFKENTKAIVVESDTNIAGATTKLASKLKQDTTMRKYFIPLLNLTEENLYAISTMSTVNFGLTESYMPNISGDKSTFKTQLTKIANEQEAFLEFWYRISNKKDLLVNGKTIVVIDTMQKYSDNRLANPSTLWSKVAGEEALSGVKEFMTPMKHHNVFFLADGVAQGDVVVLYLAKGLTDRGQSVYTHELTHILDEKVWFDGYKRRTGQQVEVFARGMFESYNNSVGESAYPPMFNLNTIYSLGNNRTQNASPERFQTDADLKQYMQGVFDVVYTLDYLEAEKILSMSAEDKAILFNKLELIDDTNRVNQVKDSFRNITVDEASQLNSIDDLVDNNITSGRLNYKGNLTVGEVKPNDYNIVQLFTPIYAAVQNNNGSVGDITFRLHAYELLAEYGYTNGMMPYISNKYDTDGLALNEILDSSYGGNIKSFKKAMYNRRIENIDRLVENGAFTSIDDLKSKMSEAVDKDLARMKQNKSIGQAINTGVTAVNDLKLKIYQNYLLSTNDFRTSIYGDKSNQEKMYIKIFNSNKVGEKDGKDIMHIAPYNDYSGNVEYKIYSDNEKTKELNKDTTISWEVEAINGFEDFNNDKENLLKILERKETTIDVNSPKNTNKVSTTKSGIYKITATLPNGESDFIYLVVPGDINRNGEVESGDIAQLYKYYRSAKTNAFSIFDEFTLLLADMDKNSEHNPADLAILSKIYKKI